MFKNTATKFPKSSLFNRNSISFNYLGKILHCWNFRKCEDCGGGNLFCINNDNFKICLHMLVLQLLDLLKWQYCQIKCGVEINLWKWLAVHKWSNSGRANQDSFSNCQTLSADCFWENVYLLLNIPLPV